MMNLLRYDVHHFKKIVRSCIGKQQKKLIHFLLLLSALIAVTQSCNVEKCASEQAQQMDERVILPQKSLEYCQVLNNYISCLNNTSRTCHSRLDYHSAITAARQRWKRFYCVDFKQQLYLLLRSEQHNICHFWSETPQKNQVFCGIFGRAMHLHAFSLNAYESTLPNLQRCSFRGTRPMLDNRFFVVQVSAGPQKPFAAIRESNAKFNNIEKAVILIKAQNHCLKQQKVYEISAKGSDASARWLIPNAFTDGSNSVTTEDEFGIKKVVEIIMVEESMVEIWLHHLKTVFTVRYDDGIISIFIQAPRRILHTAYDGMPTAQICHIKNAASYDEEEDYSRIETIAAQICDVKAAALFFEALSRPHLFQKCTFRNDRVDERISEQHALKECANANLFGEYFDACIFEMLLIAARDSTAISATLAAISNAQAFEITNEVQPDKDKSTWYSDEGMDNNNEHPGDDNEEEKSFNEKNQTRQSLDIYAKNEQLGRKIEQECLDWWHEDKAGKERAHYRVRSQLAADNTRNGENIKKHTTKKMNKSEKRPNKIILVENHQLKNDEPSSAFRPTIFIALIIKAYIISIFKAYIIAI